MKIILLGCGKCVFIIKVFKASLIKIGLTKLTREEGVSYNVLTCIVKL